MTNKNPKIVIEENVYFNIFWPNNNEEVQSNWINNNALVCKFNYKNVSMLFTGDIEKEAEEELVNKYKNTNLLKSTILKVGHHGSKTSSSKEFLELVNPKISLIGVGKNNNFGHPNTDTIERLESIRSKVYRTDEDGEITITINPKSKISVNKMIK